MRYTKIVNGKVVEDEWIHIGERGESDDKKTKQMRISDG